MDKAPDKSGRGAGTPGFGCSGTRGLGSLGTRGLGYSGCAGSARAESLNPESRTLNPEPRPLSPRRRRALVLPMVLLVLVIVAVMASSFAFHTSARLSATRAVAARLQTRLAAEAGLEKVKLLLANQRINMDVWYHNPDELHRILVWKPGGDAGGD